MLLMVLCLTLALSAQQPAGTSVIFTFDFPGSDPSHFEMAVTADGHATYSSETKPNEPDAGAANAPDSPDSYHIDFVLSSPTLTHIFDLTKRANYFSGQLDSGKKNLASTGSKTLAYKSPDRSNRATFNYSPNSAVQELTAIFQNLSTTLEFARRLDHDLRYQKTALDEELKKMEEMQARGSLGELSVAGPVLQSIAADSTIMNISRTRAQRLLAEAASSK